MIEIYMALALGMSVGMAVYRLWPGSSRHVSGASSRLLMYSVYLLVFLVGVSASDSVAEALEKGEAGFFFHLLVFLLLPGVLSVAVAAVMLHGEGRAG